MNAFSILLNYFQKYPLKLFLFDGAGAMLTAASIAGVKWYGSQFFGLPANVLALLSAIAFVFALYSWAIYLAKVITIKKFLLPIMIANLLYCILSATVIVSFKSDVTVIGWAYFLFEIIVIGFLVFLEYSVYHLFEKKLL